jgi:hypothetical protein
MCVKTKARSGWFIKKKACNAQKKKLHEVHGA